MSGELRPSRQRAVAFLSTVGEATRTELADELGLPKATVALIVAELVERGVITEGPPAERRPGQGRPARVLALVGPPAALVSLSWSAGTVRATLVTVSGRVLARSAVPMRPDLPTAEAVDQVAGLLEALCTEAGHALTAVTAVVFSVPAPVTHGTVSPFVGPVKRAEWLPSWLDDGFVSGLTARSGVRTMLENDAHLAALGEQGFGAGRGKPDQVVVKVSSRGVGAGLVLGGRLHRGLTGSAGELAHVQVRDDGPLCSCGGRGCLMRTIGAEMIDLAQPAYAEPLTFDSMLSLAGAGDVGLQRLLRDLGRAIGRPLADLCTMLSPDLFVLDGGLGPAGVHVLAGLTDAIERYARPATSAAVRVVLGELGAEAEVFGAVMLVRDASPQALPAAAASARS